MRKSNQSYLKRQKEEARIKKRKDKLQKRLERKNSTQAENNTDNSVGIDMGELPVE